MKKEQTKTIKRTVAKAAGSSLTAIAGKFAMLACCGPWYEVKVPSKLQK